ncbi:MAG: SUMF1/EgtB/PvdO family nonheme iron enzyme, partial [Planctomycetes bacterium]|nr:SUMF1/EgtB/PvdO family nonheme iron enzyme [Planctomycetota bacterium]
MSYLRSFLCLRTFLPFCFFLLGTAHLRAEISQQIRSLASLEFALIPAGNFLMGSPSGEFGREEDEIPHRVRISAPFWMSRHEITQAQYKLVSTLPDCRFKGDERPVERLNWFEAA